MKIEAGNKPEEINLKIEKATLNDLPEIQELTKKLFDYEITKGFDDNLDADWSFSEEGKKELQDRITAKDSVGLVSKVDGKVAGYLIGLIREEETGRTDTQYAELEHMFVDEIKRSSGIGKNLAEEFKIWAKENGLKRLKVNVSYNNKKAIEFYKKAGLMPVDVTMSGEIEE